MRRSILFLPLLLAACAPPRDQVVLLDAAPGEQLTVTAGAHTAVLTVPRSAVQVSPGGDLARTMLTAQDIARRYGAVLAFAPQPGRLFTLHFATGETQLTDASQAEVPALLAEVTRRGAVEVLIEGHSSQTGEDAANDALSYARAEAVRALLVAQGLTATFVRVVGRGSRAPIVDRPGQDEARNRRVEVLVR